MEFELIRVLYTDEEVLEAERAAYESYMGLPEDRRDHPVKYAKWWPNLAAAGEITVDKVD